MGEIGARLDALDKRLDTGLATADKQLSSGLEAVHKQLGTGLETADKQLSSGPGAIHKQLDGIDGRFDRLEASLNLFAHVQSIEARLSRMEGKAERPSA